jgi:crotonobetainyl-CoA:carnitine CoA-transferase CaiB-like acyl-CoA transferase
MVVDIDDPAAGPIRIAGNPIKLSNHEDPTSRGAVPKLDEHRQSILDELDKG